MPDAWYAKSAENRAKHYANNRKWIAANPEKRKNAHHRSHLKKTYGVSLEEYNELLIKQDGKCRICGVNKPPRGKRHFDVDHCHKTGVVRGLLCSDCNIGIAAFKDNPELMGKAITYIMSMPPPASEAAPPDGEPPTNGS